MASFYIILSCCILLFCGVSCVEDLNLDSLQSDDASYICNKCKCVDIPSNNNQEGFLDIKCIYKLEVNNMIWPENNTQNIVITFENFDMRTVQMFPENQFIVSLRLNDNNIGSIEPSAFAKISNLQYLSLASNNLTAVAPDMFENLNQLRELDLSNNKLSDFNKLDFKHLTLLKILVLNGNGITKIPLLNTIRNLEELYLSNNKIFFLNFDLNEKENVKIIENLKIFDVSYNQLTVITREIFYNAKSLEYLNLSNNNIKNIDDDTFQNCNQLKRIDLSSNEITILPKLPSTVSQINLHKNSFNEWPIFSESVTILDISQNKLYSIYNENEVMLDNLEYLNVSNNDLQNFEMTKQLKKLLVLDISYNAMKMIPSNLNANNLPALEYLRVDGNPISELKIENTLNINRFSANYLSTITEIKKNSLNIKPLKCIDISISHCDELAKIEDETFNNIDLCHLDISYNKLSSLSPIASAKNGINLQGNPWNCDCDLQWILDDILNDLYVNHSSMLFELRCENPRQLKGMRFVHWYKWQGKAFCNDPTRRKFNEEMKLLETTSSSSNSLGDNYIVTIVLFVIIAALFIIVAALIVYLIKGRVRQKQYIKNKRIRQSAYDYRRPYMNGENRVLTGV